LFEFEKETRRQGRTALFSHIVTTNYDLVLERCAQENSDVCSGTGVEIDPNTGEYYLPIQKFLLGEGNYHHNIEYLKLHGSINWWIRERDKKIIRRNETQPSVSLMGESYQEQLMIYPIYEKYVSEDPYFSLYYYFRKLLYFHEEYVVIGYSFRDPSINNAFADSLKDRRKRIIIVNNNRNSIGQRITENFPTEQMGIIEILSEIITCTLS
jgi:SIR2-like domain